MHTRAIRASQAVLVLALLGLAALSGRLDQIHPAAGTVLLTVAAVAAILGIGIPTGAGLVRDMVRDVVREELRVAVDEFDRRLDEVIDAQTAALRLAREEGIREGALRARLGRDDEVASVHRIGEQRGRHA